MCLMRNVVNHGCDTFAATIGCGIIVMRGARWTTTMNLVLPHRMTVDEFLAWSVTQPKEAGRFELLDGMVIMQQSQQWGHAKTKQNIYRALDRAIERAGLAYFATGEGPTVRIGPRTAFERDALVAPLPEPDDTALEINNPIVVVEVLSPSTARHDTTVKLKRYFQLKSVQHYLIVDWEGRLITHHRRSAEGKIETEVLDGGVLALDSPGITFNVDDVFGPRRAKT
jgi:Uma2 family endonuclease